MAKTFTLAEIRTRVRETSDMEGMDTTTGHIDDTELDGYINQSFSKLYDILVQKGIYQYETTNDFTGTGVATYSLPADFYAPGSVFYVDSERLNPIKEIQLSEIHLYKTTAVNRSSAYRVHGSVIEFYPPPSGGTYRMYYAPAYTTLSADGDTVDGVNGWEEFIVLDSAVKCLMKENSPSDDLLRERQMLLDRVDAMAKNKRQGPFRIVDTEVHNSPTDPADWRWNIW